MMMMVFLICLGICLGICLQRETRAVQGAPLQDASIGDNAPEGSHCRRCHTLQKRPFRHCNDSESLHLADEPG